MSNVVALRVVETKPTPRTYSEAFDGAWKAYPDLGRLRSSRKEAWKAWQKVVKETGEPELVAAVQRYVREDKEHRKECGPPGFHRWLNWGRYEHWLGQPEASAMPTRRFPHQVVRSEVARVKGENFVGAYLDPCEVDGSILIVKTGVAIDRLKELAPLFRSHGFTAMRRA